MPPKAKGKSKAKVPPAANAAKTAASPGERSLHGAVVAITGDFDEMTRVEAEDKIKAAGAKLMGNVSSKTTFLIVGSQRDDGRQVEETGKYKKYLDLKSKGGQCPEILREPQLLQLLFQVNDHAVKQPQAPVVVRKSEDMTPAERAVPWVDKHAPNGLDALLGNAKAVKGLTDWLRDWDDVVLRGRKKPIAFRPGGGAPNDVNARAALISGPPGIGKTTAARLVARALGWNNILEFNASDARGQKVINSMAEGLADNRMLTFGGAVSPGKPSLTSSSCMSALIQRSVIIMDEVDGMGGGDRGGNGALIKMIKKTRNPIICICNDAHAQKVRTLSFSCYDVKFARPTKNTIALRAAEIAANEGLSLEINALEALTESCGNDIRHVLNQLQILAKLPQYQKSAVCYMEMKDRLQVIAKDEVVMINPFSSCNNLLTTSFVNRMTLREKFDHYFVDHQLMHLMIQENYLSSVIRKPVDCELLDKCARSAENIVIGDMVNERIRSKQEWSLLPNMGLFSTVIPASITNGFISFPEFPKFLGNYSKMGRGFRLKHELHAHLRLFSVVKSRSLVQSGFAEVLFRTLLNKLEAQDVASCVDILDAYGLQREHLAEHLNELQQHLSGEDAFKLVDPKMKSAMTREMNSGSHMVKVFLPPSKKRKAAVPQNDGLDGEEEAAESAAKQPQGEEEAAQEDTEELGGLAKISKKKKEPAKKPKEGKDDLAKKAGKPSGKGKAKAKPSGGEPPSKKPKK